MTDPAPPRLPPSQPGTPEGRRAVELLWDPPAPAPSRGPRPKTSLAEVVDAGVAIADAEGLEALSMRKVASRLGIGAMSLYTYVPGRSELIELMIDRVYADHALPDPGLGWRARLEQWIQRDLADLRRASVAAGLQHGPAADRTARAGCGGGALRGVVRGGIHRRAECGDRQSDPLAADRRRAIHDRRCRRGAAHRGLRRGLLGVPRQLLDDLLRRDPIPDHGRGLGEMAASTTRPAGTSSR